ncbi:hypothetical protein KAM472_36410 [Aeromonas caviae]|nr:hypothetical protein KAM462_35340 [Aeromonas caviae]GKR12350.1 hypothetical protein KAM465_39270 [Aeromonas caviae]GKR33887.1 hypothetical protein KAM470_39600 [Aeromonas caviae]GKR41945.1 hypothetical protein KAM472_36410 [Aeromonas caviae]GKR46312.1 hypothetical protein KAM473_38310 [Aeromonas caviae]
MSPFFIENKPCEDARDQGDRKEMEAVRRGKWEGGEGRAPTSTRRYASQDQADLVMAAPTM